MESKPGQTRWVLKVGLNPGALQGGSGEQYFVGQFDGDALHQRQSSHPHSLDRLWQGLLLRADVQQSAAHPISGYDRLDEQLAVCRRCPDEALARTNDRAAQARRCAIRQRAFAWCRILSTLWNSFGIPGIRRATPSNCQSTVQLGNAKEVGWRLMAADGTFTLVGYDREKQQFFVDRTHSGNTGFSKDFPARTTAPLHLMATSFDCIFWWTEVPSKSSPRMGQSP